MDMKWCQFEQDFYPISDFQYDEKFGLVHNLPGRTPAHNAAGLICDENDYWEPPGSV